MMTTCTLLLCFALSVILVSLPQPCSCQQVLVLGAGAAGITAARILKDNGITFLVLEAQDYIGGRMKSVDFAGMKIEEGANWVHYMENTDNPLIKLKDELKLRGKDSNFEDYLMKYDSNIEINTEQEEKAIQQWEEVSETLIPGMIEKRKDLNLRDMPLSTALEIQGWRPDTPLKKTLEWFELDFEYAAATNERSFNNIGDSPKENFFVTDQEGFWKIFEGFYKDFKDAIFTNHVVNEINWDTKKTVTVRTENGKIFTADYVLVTFSSGVLGSESIKFTPPLPPWKKEAIHRLRPVHFTKIFLKFQSQFWEKKEWIKHASKEPGNKFLAFFNLNQPGFFDQLPKKITPNALLTVVTGDEALRIEKQDDEITRKEVMEALKKMYGSQIPEATDIHVSKWSQNPYVRCAWTDPVVGTSTGHFQNMAGRLNNLFFAGESTSEYRYGYIQGSYNTGQLQANHIISCIKGLPTCKEYKPVTQDV